MYTTVKSDALAVHNLASLRSIRENMGLGQTAFGLSAGLSGAAISLAERFPQRCSARNYNLIAEFLQWDKFVPNRQSQNNGLVNSLDKEQELSFDFDNRDEDNFNSDPENNKNRNRKRADITVTLPFDMKDNLKSFANEKNCTVSAVVERAVRIFLAFKEGEA